MAILESHKSDFVSPRLTDAKRAELAAACADSKRTTYYDLSHEDILDRNHFTYENCSYGILTLDWETCIDRVGLVVSDCVETPKLDKEGEPIVDEEGVPVVTREYGLHDFKVKVDRAGLVDSEGTVIPKGSVSFRVTKQATNRPRNETNFKALANRMAKGWAFNGEPMIKDFNEVGASEQHRLIAKIIRILTGDAEPDDQDDWSFFFDGVHPDTVITIDTGKSNTGKDIFGSDPEIAPPHILQTHASIMGTTEAVTLVDDPVKERTKICGETESATKLVLLRLAGKNVNASLGNSQAATEKAHRFATTTCPDMDALVARCHVFIQNISFKDRPVSTPELAASLALWYLKDEEYIDTIPRKDVDGGRDMDSVVIRFDLDRVTALLADLTQCTSMGRLMEWAKDRVSPRRKGNSRQIKFAQVVRMIMDYMSTTDNIDPTINNQDKDGIGKVQDAKQYLHFGGADRGPIPKKERSSD